MSQKIRPSYSFDRDTGWIDRDGHPIARVFENRPGAGFYHGLSPEEVVALGDKIAGLLNEDASK